jgi:hypothetical protein
MYSFEDAASSISSRQADGEAEVLNVEDARRNILAGVSNEDLPSARLHRQRPFLRRHVRLDEV